MGRVISVPPHLQWLDDAARGMYETMHRYSEADGGTPNVPWGWDWSGTEHAPGRRPWEFASRITTAFGFYAVLALAGQPAERLAAVVTWARGAAAERGEPPHDRVSLRPFSALADEAERLAGGAS